MVKIQQMSNLYHPTDERNPWHSGNHLEMNELHEMLWLYHPTYERNPWYSGNHIKMEQTKQQIANAPNLTFIPTHG